MFGIKKIINLLNEIKNNQLEIIRLLNLINQPKITFGESVLNRVNEPSNPSSPDPGPFTPVVTFYVPCSSCGKLTPSGSVPQLNVRCDECSMNNFKYIPPDMVYTKNEPSLASQLPRL